MADSFLIYILKVNLVVSITCLFFLLFLRKLSFYRWNRWFLLSGLVLSFILPAVRIGELSKGNLLQNISRFVPADMIPLSITVPAGAARFNFWPTGTIIVITGSVIFLTVFLFKLKSLICLIRKSTPFARETNVWLVNAPVSPFSFLDRIYLNQAVYSREQLEFIIAHEKVHVRELHSLDIFVSELFVAICWFNPLAWIYQRAIKENLEYIADASVLRQGHDARQYQLCLLNLSRSSGWEWPVAPFSMNSFRKRLYFMNRLKASAWYQVFRYAFILPVLTVTFLSFNAASLQSGKVQEISGKSAKITGHLNIYIKKDHALLHGEHGIAEIRGVKSLNIEKYPDALLLHKGKEFSIDKLSDHLDPNRRYVLYVYLGSYAQQKYGSKGKAGIVTITTYPGLASS